jgi:translation initiation factor eIF-2B subunit beta
MMTSVNKVIIGTRGVMANGGLIAHTGAHNIAMAAKHHSVPFVVVTGLHKVSPSFTPYHTMHVVSIV